eukprot:CAMPEP_0182485760 /NCGR_PEP_ID=MMETSP1319-20130603/45805_1 /TAXON_ID=172717 /ORGANISM="Bolidomonas pacifica, Strain RCC208" /LENGTH=44 /DNA_ID= /DNA_START= /DNA_END= /DNA_ORIENTATION=
MTPPPTKYGSISFWSHPSLKSVMKLSICDLDRPSDTTQSPHMSP